MQIMITHDASARVRVLQLSRWQLALLALGLLFALMLSSGAVYHWFFLKAARDGWPVVSAVVKWVVRDEIAQRDRFLRENLDAIAQKVGEVQAKLVRLEAVSERVSGLAGSSPRNCNGSSSLPAAARRRVAGGAAPAAPTVPTAGRLPWGGVGEPIFRCTARHWRNCTARWPAWTVCRTSMSMSSRSSNRGCSRSACAVSWCPAQRLWSAP